MQAIKERVLSDPNGVLLVVFSKGLGTGMGSGSTGVACLNTGRKFIGIEKDEQYFKVAKERIESVQKALEMQKQEQKEQQEEQKQAQNDYDEQEVEFTDETLSAIDEIDALFDHSDDVD